MDVDRTVDRIYVDYHLDDPSGRTREAMRTVFYVARSSGISEGRQELRNSILELLGLIEPK